MDKKPEIYSSLFYHANELPPIEDEKLRLLLNLKRTLKNSNYHNRNLSEFGNPKTDTHVAALSNALACTDADIKHKKEELFTAVFNIIDNINEKVPDEKVAQLYQELKAYKIQYEKMQFPKK